MEYFKDCMNKEQLDAAYKEWVKRLHPDRNPGNPNATAEFQEMQAQYEERLAELNGDYTKARKGRERREREERERREREAKERERRKVEQVIAQARLNRQKSHRELKAGDYVYANAIKWNYAYDASTICANDVLRQTVINGIKDECVVVIEKVIHLNEDILLNGYLCNYLHDIYGGYEVLQTADPASGVRKGKRVAKVVMFCSNDYCIFGNPMGDHTISDYYMPLNYETMFGSQLDRIKAQIAQEKAEKARIEAEKKARLLAEQAPLIEEWKPKLIELSAGLSGSERLTVAMNNFKTMLKHKFGTTFNVRKDRYNDVCIKWEDGPTIEDVCKVMDLFDAWKTMGGKEPTPWMERYGKISFSLGNVDRKMSVLTKARILQQLGQVTEAFRSGSMDDDVTVSDFDWMMIHLLVGIDINSSDAKLCMSTLHADGTRSVRILSAVNFIFSHSSYTKTKAAKKKAA